MESRVILAGELVPLLNAYTELLQGRIPMKYALPIARCVKELENRRDEIVHAAQVAMTWQNPEKQIEELNNQHINIHVVTFPAHELESWDTKVSGTAMYVLVYHDLIEGEPDADTPSS